MVKFKIIQAYAMSNILSVHSKVLTCMLSPSSVCTFDDSCQTLHAAVGNVTELSLRKDSVAGSCLQN